MRYWLAVIGFVFSVDAGAQTDVRAPEDEQIVLDAAEKRIVKADYRAHRAVSARGGEAGGWQLNAGAAIEARRIDLTLRNVQGVVRFRADASRIEELFARSERRRLGRVPGPDRSPDSH